ncbi:MAG TPA: hypothetical protein VJU61_11975 [Polyangiaceae bacterium]|nr:hypothetical protein [Polyangiaceae bacterium]
MTLADLALDTVVRRLVAAADKASAKLEEDEDWKAYWSVEHDLVSQLHKLGVFGAVEKPIDPTLQRDQMQQEIASLVALELKKQKREAEMLQMQRGSG